MTEQCEHLGEILAAEKQVMIEHLGDLIKDRKLVADFIDLHGEEMRADYCGKECPDRYGCQTAQKYIGGK